MLAQRADTQVQAPGTKLASRPPEYMSQVSDSLRGVVILL